MAAAAFAAAAPGATVIAISPQATLSRDIAPWETRYRRVWRRDFSSRSRYSYAPDGAASASRVFLFYDPVSPLDAMHAALFASPQVERYHCRRMGPPHRLALAGHGYPEARRFGLRRGSAEPALVLSLPAAGRRESARYERELLEAVEARRRPDLVARLCRAVLAPPPAPEVPAARCRKGGGALRLRDGSRARLLARPGGGANLPRGGGILWYGRRAGGRQTTGGAANGRGGAVEGGGGQRGPGGCFSLQSGYPSNGRVPRGGGLQGGGGERTGGNESAKGEKG